MRATACAYEEMDQPLTLEGERILLRTLDAADAQGPYRLWMNDPQVTRFLESRFRSFSEADLRKFIGDANARPDTVFLGIFLRERSQHIGNIKVEVSRPHLRGEVGVLVGDKEQWGKGYASEAIGRLAQYAFADLKLHKLTAGCYGANVGSMRAFESAGFFTEGVRARHYALDGEWLDLVLMARFSPEAVPPPLHKAAL
jgi:ribosomal-protein-alanine N-acetyltransferase